MRSIKQIDLDNIELFTEIFDEYRALYVQPSDIERGRNFLVARLSENTTVIFVAFENSVPLGFTQLYPRYSSIRATRDWILNDLYVRKIYRMQGIATSLIDTAVTYATLDGSSFLELSTGENNFNAQKLYQKSNFVRFYDEGYYTYRRQLN